MHEGRRSRVSAVARDLKRIASGWESRLARITALAVAGASRDARPKGCATKDVPVLVDVGIREMPRVDRGCPIGNDNTTIGLTV